MWQLNAITQIRDHPETNRLITGCFRFKNGAFVSKPGNLGRAAQIFAQRRAPCERHNRLGCGLTLGLDKIAVTGRKLIKLGILCAVFWFGGPAFGQGRYVAVGAMEWSEVNHPAWEGEWRLKYRGLVEASFKLMRSSYRQVERKMALENLNFKEIFTHGKVLTSSRFNRNAVAHFHQNADDFGSLFLESVACHNQAVVLLFAEAPDPSQIATFISSQPGKQTLLLAINCYYPASNVIGFEYVKITHAMLEDPSRLRQDLEKAILAAMEQSITNSAGASMMRNCAQIDAELDRLTKPDQPPSIRNPQTRVQPPNKIEFNTKVSATGW